MQKAMVGRGDRCQEFELLTNSQVIRDTANMQPTQRVAGSLKVILVLQELLRV